MIHRSNQYSNQIQNHLDNECPKQELACPFADCGCDFRGQRTAIAQHMKESPGLHLNIAGKTISIQKKLLQAYEERTNEQKKWIETLARKVNALEKTYGAQYIWKIDHYQVECLFKWKRSSLKKFLTGAIGRSTYKS